MAAKQPLVACEHCASVFLRPVLQHGETAKCTRCDSVPWRYSGLGLSHWLALAISTAILFVLANAYPVASLSVQGMTQRATLLDAVLITWTQGHELVALMTALAGFFLLLVQLSLLLWILTYLCAGREPPGLRFCVRFMGQLRPWCMVPVFLLGVLVSVVKLVGMAAVKLEPGVGLAAFGALTVMLTVVGRLSPTAIWRHAEDIGVADATVPYLASNPCLASCAMSAAWFKLCRKPMPITRDRRGNACTVSRPCIIASPTIWPAPGLY
jgi:paraquat-inducible protein A